MSDCACMRKARKTYTCCECNCEIKPGNNYEYFTGLYDDRWSTYRTCSCCVEVRRALICGSFEYGRLYEVIREASQEDIVPWDKIGNLSIPARDKVLECIQDEFDEWQEEDAEEDEHLIINPSFSQIIPPWHAY